MKTTCEKCGGLLIGEQALDYYQGMRWKCVNCGRYRVDGQALLGSARRHHELERLQIGLNHDQRRRNMSTKKPMTAESPMKLVLCDCGKLHVTWGSVTLHFTHDEFLLFAESARRLAAIVAQPPSNQASAATPSTITEMCH